VPEQVERQVAGRDLDRGPDQPPDHLPEEVRGAEPQQQQVAVLRHLGPVDDDDRARVGGRLLAES
jgi:hypothetical protein